MTDRMRLADTVAAGLAAMIGAGVLVGLAPAASVAGWWLLAGTVAAALVASAFAELSTVDPTTGWPWRVVGGLGVLGRLVGGSAVAGAFGANVLPGAPVPAAVGLVLVATVASGSGLRPGAALTRSSVLVVVGVLLVFVVVCFAIEPVAPAVAAPPGTAGSDDPVGLPVAAGLMFFAFLGFDRGRSVGRRVAVPVTIGIALAVYLAVGTAALRQLGGPRLALSPAPLRDALAAADASALVGLLTAGVAVAALSVLLGLYGALTGEWGNRAAWPAGVAVAIGAVLLTPSAAIAVATCLMLGHYLLGVLAARLPRATSRGG